MTNDEVLALVSVQLGVEVVVPAHDFQRDLGAESADVLNIVAAAEDRWNIVVSEEALAEIRTVADLVETLRRSSEQPG